MLDIAIAVASGVEMTRKWYDSIIKYTDVPYTIYMVDNTRPGKPDNSEFKGKDHVVYSHHEFTSLAGMWNIAVKQGTNPFVLVASNDTLVPERWTRMITFMKEHHLGELNPVDTTAVGHVLPFRNDAPIIESDYYSRAKSHYEKYRGLYNNYLQYDVCRMFKRGVPHNIPMSGAHMLFTREALASVGYFDERYKVYLDDSDILLAVNMKYPVGVLGDLLIYHKGGGTIYPITDLGGDNQTESAKKFSAKWTPILNVLS